MLIAVRFCVKAQETPVILSGDLHLQPCAGRNAFKSSKFDVLDVVFGRVCTSFLNHQPPGTDPRGDEG